MRFVAYFIGAVLFSSVLAFGQADPPTQPLSPEEAMKRLKERQAQRDAARQQVVTITRGELDDVRAEIAALKAEITKLKGEAVAAEPANAPAAAPAAPRFVSKITTGVTRAQLMTFIAMHKDKYRIARDVRQPDRQELMTVEKFKVKEVDAGTSTNGVNTVRLAKKEAVVLISFELILKDDAITSIDDSNGDTSFD